MLLKIHIQFSQEPNPKAYIKYFKAITRGDNLLIIFYVGVINNNEVLFFFSGVYWLYVFLKRVCGKVLEGCTHSLQHVQSNLKYIF
jgi:hypothetical protein